MENMFNNAISFNQYLGWCLDGVYTSAMFSRTLCYQTNCGVNCDDELYEPTSARRGTNCADDAAASHATPPSHAARLTLPVAGTSPRTSPRPDRPARRRDRIECPQGLVPAPLSRLPALPPPPAHAIGSYLSLTRLLLEPHGDGHVCSCGFFRSEP